MNRTAFGRPVHHRPQVSVLVNGVWVQRRVADRRSGTSQTGFRRRLIEGDIHPVRAGRDGVSSFVASALTVGGLAA